MLEPTFFCKGSTITFAALGLALCAHDWFPTLAAAAGVSLPSNAKLDGCDQCPAVQSGEIMNRPPFLIDSHEIALFGGEWKFFQWVGGR